jgi:DNA-binding NarL/FixJ family response regulator
MHVLIVDDERLFADALRSVLESSGETVVGVAADGPSALAIAQRDHVELVLLDLHLRGASGLDVGRRLLTDHSHLKVVALTVSREARSVQEVVRAGFHGYLTKDMSFARLLSAIHAIREGHVVMPHHIAPHVAGRLTPEERNAYLLTAQLTPRERDVLALLAIGANSKTIAKKLAVTPNTVRTHVQSIHSKLGVHSRLEAVAFAVRYGVAKVDPTYGFGLAASETAKEGVIPFDLGDEMTSA